VEKYEPAQANLFIFDFVAAYIVRQSDGRFLLELDTVFVVPFLPAIRHV
jgi:hypothetical protein